MSYTHLSQSERYQIQWLKKAGFPLRQIAREMGRADSTISREPRRNARQQAITSRAPPIG